MRTSRLSARLLATAGAAAVFTAALTSTLVTASHAEVTAPGAIVQISDGVAWH